MGFKVQIYKCFGSGILYFVNRIPIIPKRIPPLYDQNNKYCIAFYNLENFFDTRDDPHGLDDDFTPQGELHWNENRFRNKARKMGRAIAEIGSGESPRPPVLVGLAEVENRGVIEVLLKTDAMKDQDYGFVHFNSPDERGIDTALLYLKEHFEPLESRSLPLIVDNTNGERDYTRDILYVRGRLNGEEVRIFVNHWPSRREGDQETAYKRIIAAQRILEELQAPERDSSKLILMGDFNDDPNSESIQTLMASGLFINPMEQLLGPKSGSASYRGEWNLFDQILISHNFLQVEPGTHGFVKAEIFAPRFLREWKGRYKGLPFRTYAGRKYLGGYSDHFPVYLIVEQRE